MRALIVAIIVMLFSTSLYASRLPPSYLVALEVHPSKTLSRFTFIFDKKTIGRIAVLTDRVIVELDNVSKAFDIEDLPLRNSNVSAIESEALPFNKLRFIFYVSKPVSAKALFTVNHLLHIDITTKPKVALAKHKKKKVTVVIDAGHGGTDSGARGQDGALEKHIVLAIAKRLAAKLKQTGEVRVVLTRNQDHYVPLRERLTVARRSKANLFLSVHADGYYNERAKGASIYALSEGGATNEAARWLANRDNYSELSGLSLNTLYDKSPMLRKVLIDLAQTATIKSSLTLGNYILRSLDDIADLHHKRVEQAPFLVLKSPDIPSILVETGFMSNPDEELRLKNVVYQDNIAEALYRGVLAYLKL